MLDARERRQRRSRARPDRRGAGAPELRASSSQPSASGSPMSLISTCGAAPGTARAPRRRSRPRRSRRRTPRAPSAAPPRIRLVLDRQDPQSMEVVRGLLHRRDRILRVGLGGGRRGERQAQAKIAPCPSSTFVAWIVPPWRSTRRFDDGEPQAEPRRAAWPAASHRCGIDRTRAAAVPDRSPDHRPR